MRAFLYILIPIIAIGILLLIYAIIEARLLEIKEENIDISSDNPSPLSLRIFYFSDLHAEFCFISPEKICTIIENKHKAGQIDAVIFGGDICNKPGHYQKGANYLNKISLTCNALGIPFLGTSGNHDVELSSKELSLCGFENISDTNYLLKKDDKTIRFSGVSDSGRHTRVWREIPPCNENYDLHILLSHNPDQILYTKDDMPEIMLSGHIHGGQIRTPFKIEFTLLRKDELPRMGIISGQQTVCGVKTYISRGVGCVFLPLRLGSRPEVTIINIKK